MGSMYQGRALLAQVVEAKNSTAKQAGAELRELHAIRLAPSNTLEAQVSPEVGLLREAYFANVRFTLAVCGPAPVGDSRKRAREAAQAAQAVSTGGK